MEASEDVEEKLDETFTIKPISEDEEPADSEDEPEEPADVAQEIPVRLPSLGCSAIRD